MKLVKELKDKILELETERNRLHGVIREKDKSSDQGIKFCKDEIDNLKREINRKEFELKKAQDDGRDTSTKDKLKISEM